MDNTTLKVEKQYLIKCWGNDIESNGVKTKKYLSCKINKEKFDIIKKYISNNQIDLDKFDYVEVIYDQVSQKLILDFTSEIGEENIIESNCEIGIFI